MRVTLSRYVAVLTLTTAAVVVVGAGAVRSYSRAEQRPLVPALREGAESRSLYSRSGQPPEGGAQPTLQTLATRAARLCGVPPAVLHALIARESSWRQYDAQGRTLRSSAGALGLTQIKPGSAREISPTLNVHQPWGNLVAGACYLSKYRRGSWRSALISYRLGPNHRRATRAAHLYAQTIMEGIE